MDLHLIKSEKLKEDKSCQALEILLVNINLVEYLYGWKTIQTFIILHYFALFGLLDPSLTL